MNPFSEKDYQEVDVKCLARTKWYGASCYMLHKRITRLPTSE